jgi:hypothetical protein
MHVIHFLDIGMGTRKDPGYLTPFAWVSKDWCRAIRARVYRHCNLKTQALADWFLKSISQSAVPFHERRGVGLHVTILVLSFVPHSHRGFTEDIRDAYISHEVCMNNTGNKCTFTASTFWQRFSSAIVEMPNLTTFVFCYNNNFHRSRGFHELSACAHLFPPTFSNLCLKTTDTTVSI